jgi:hypothetical protein
VFLVGIQFVNVLQIIYFFISNCNLLIPLRRYLIINHLKHEEMLNCLKNSVVATPIATELRGMIYS